MRWCRRAASSEPSTQRSCGFEPGRRQTRRSACSLIGAARWVANRWRPQRLQRHRLLGVPRTTTRCSRSARRSLPRSRRMPTSRTRAWSMRCWRSAVSAPRTWQVRSLLLASSLGRSSGSAEDHDPAVGLSSDCPRIGRCRVGDRRGGRRTAGRGAANHRACRRRRGGSGARGGDGQPDHHGDGSIRRRCCLGAGPRHVMPG